MPEILTQNSHTDTTEYFQYKGNTRHSVLVFALKWFHNVTPPQHLIYKQQMQKQIKQGLYLKISATPVFKNKDSEGEKEKKKKVYSP